MQISSQSRLREFSPLPSSPPARAEAGDVFVPSPPELSLHTPTRGQWVSWLALAPMALVMLTPHAAEPAPAVGLVPRHYEGPGAEHWHPPSPETERTAERIRAQQDTLRRAFGQSGPVTFTNSEGNSVELTARRIASGFEYSLKNGRAVPVRFGASFNAEQQLDVLARAIDYHSQMPPRFYHLLESISVEPGGTMGNVAGRREGNRFRFFGQENLNEGNFTHEYGHLVGSALESAQDGWIQWALGPQEPRVFPNRSHSAPDNWADAMARDQRQVSTYAQETPGMEEDFAEFFTAYHEARESGGDALPRLREAYPARAEIMRAVWS